MTQRVTLTVACNRCGTKATYHTAQAMQVAREHLQSRGWSLTFRRDLCPQCVAELTALASVAHQTKGT